MQLLPCLFLVNICFSYLKAHLLRATLSVKFLLTVVEVLILEAAARQRAELAKNDILLVRSTLVSANIIRYQPSLTLSKI